MIRVQTVPRMTKSNRELYRVLRNGRGVPGNHWAPRNGHGVPRNGCGVPRNGPSIPRSPVVPGNDPAVPRNTLSKTDVRRLLMPASFSCSPAACFSCYEISHYMLTTFIRFSRKTYRNFNGECHEKKDCHVCHVNQVSGDRARTFYVPHR